MESFYPKFSLPPEVVSIQRAVLLRQRLAIDTFKKRGYGFAEYYALWHDDEGKLEVCDSDGEKIRLTERGIKMKYEIWADGHRDDIFSSLSHERAFLDWMENDIRFTIYPWIISGESKLPDDVITRLSDLNSALTRGSRQVTDLFRLKVGDMDPSKNDPFAERVLDVLFSS